MTTPYTRHALAAEAHTHAAYEHWAAEFQERKGEFDTAHEFARRACEYSKQGAILSAEAYTQTKGVAAGPISGRTSTRQTGSGSKRTTASTCPSVSPNPIH
jgi:hypothetical protein